MNFTVTMIADEINVTTMTNLDRWDDECDDETLSFGKKCETSRSELQLLKAAETKGKYLEVWAPVRAWLKVREKRGTVFRGLSSRAFKVNE